MPRKNQPTRSGPNRYKLFISHAWDHDDDYNRLVALLHDHEDFDWDNHSVPKDHPLQLQTGPKLRDGLRRKMHYCHALLVISGMYAGNRTWMQQEIDIAARYRKPIIALRPYGASKVPRAVRDAANATVGWRGPSIVEAIRTLVD
mgnify:CR=1 FL=1